MTTWRRLFLTDRDGENPFEHMDRTHAIERICFLFTIELRIPKLDVAGSITVSRFSHHSEKSLLMM